MNITLDQNKCDCPFCGHRVNYGDNCDMQLRSDAIFDINNCIYLKRFREFRTKINNLTKPIDKQLSELNGTEKEMVEKPEQPE